MHSPSAIYSVPPEKARIQNIPLKMPGKGKHPPSSPEADPVIWGVMSFMDALRYFKMNKIINHRLELEVKVSAKKRKEWLSGFSLSEPPISSINQLYLLARHLALPENAGGFKAGRADSEAAKAVAMEIKETLDANEGWKGVCGKFHFGPGEKLSKIAKNSHDERKNAARLLFSYKAITGLLSWMGEDTSSSERLFQENLLAAMAPRPTSAKA